MAFSAVAKSLGQIQHGVIFIGKKSIGIKIISTMKVEGATLLPRCPSIVVFLTEISATYLVETPADPQPSMP